MDLSGYGPDWGSNPQPRHGESNALATAPREPYWWYYPTHVSIKHTLEQLNTMPNMDSLMQHAIMAFKIIKRYDNNTSELGATIQ